jgi:YHS domain-containing protein
MDQQQMNAAAGMSSTGSPDGGQLDPETQGALDPNPGNLRTNRPDLARDPVCGALVEKASATNMLPAPVNMPGEDTIYFDSPECKALYEKDPQRYSAQR